MLLDPLKTILGYGTYTFSEDSTDYTVRVVPSFHDDEKGGKLPIAGVDEFMKGWEKITISKGSVLSVVPGRVPKGPEIVLLKYHGQAE